MGSGGDYPVLPRFKTNLRLSLLALTPVACRGGLRLHDQRTLSRAMGTGVPPSIPERILVFTIAISAPQHVHSIGARALIQAIDRPFVNLGMSGGYGARFADDESKYDSHACFVDGRPCYSDEARFGGAVIEVNESN